MYTYIDYIETRWTLIKENKSAVFDRKAERCSSLGYKCSKLSISKNTLYICKLIMYIVENYLMIVENAAAMAVDKKLQNQDRTG